MHNVYTFLLGPGAWITWGIFLGGSIYRLVSITFLAKSRDEVVLRYFNLKFALRSILHWSIPFGTTNMRRHWIMTFISFCFHIGVIITPIFLSAHNILLKEYFNVYFITIPNWVADILTVFVLCSCIFFVLRKIFVREVRFVTSFTDYVLILLVFLPFLFGFLAYHQWFNYPLMLILHILFGEILLIVIPFTRLVHMIFAPLVRAYTGSEFGGVRHAKDW
ncbi:TmcC family electron transfer complex membrane anchor subunit [Desulfonauticus submarinus]